MPRKTLISLLIISLSLFITFIGFSYFVAKERFTKFDFDTTVRIQDKTPHRLDLPFSIISFLGSAEVTGSVWLLLSIYLLWKKHWLTFLSMGLLPLAILAELFGKVYLYHPSPPHFMYRGIFDLDLPSHYVTSNYSYPSGHSIRYTYHLVFLLVVLFFKTKGLLRIVLCAGLVGFLGIVYYSRVSLGEHWMSDVIGGALLGSALALFSGLTLFFPKLTDLLKTLKRTKKRLPAVNSN